MGPLSEETRKRVRVPNFTRNEKALLAQLIKKRSIVESKKTDKITIFKKNAAWDLIEKEFNSHDHENKRDIITLKRAWDNMKAVLRKARATKRGNLSRTGGDPFPPSKPLSTEEIITMVEEATPKMICETSEESDSDEVILNSIKKTQEFNLTKYNTDDQDPLCTTPTLSSATSTLTSTEQAKDHVRKPADYRNSEAVPRIKTMKLMRKLTMKILRKKLETQEIKKRAAQLEEDKNKVLLEKATLELEELKKKLGLK